MKSCLGLMFVIGIFILVIGGGALIWYLSDTAEFSKNPANPPVAIPVSPREAAPGKPPVAIPVSPRGAAPGNPPVAIPVKPQPGR